MKKPQILNMGIMCAASALIIASGAKAADQAAAAATMAEIASISVQAKANLAGQALGGDIEQIADYAKRSDAVDAAMDQGMENLVAMEQAQANGDESAAQSAYENLQASKQNALDALNGVISDLLAQSAHQQWKESQENTGGGPGKAYDSPNIYNNTWDTEGMSSFYQGLWGNFWSSGRPDGHRGDKDATPE